MLSETVYLRLKTLGPLKRGRTLAKEAPRELPVATDRIEPLKPYLSDQVWTMIQLQLLCVYLRPNDFQHHTDVWIVEFAEHKTAFREHRRTLYFGPRAQAMRAPYLENRQGDAFLFNPTEAESDRRAAQHATPPEGVLIAHHVL